MKTRAIGLLVLVLAGVVWAETYPFTPAISKRKVKVTRKYEVPALAGQTSVVEIPAMFDFIGATNEQIIESSRFEFSVRPDEISVVSYGQEFPQKMYRLAWKSPAVIGIDITQELTVAMTVRNKLCTEAKLPYSLQVQDKFKYYLGKSKSGTINPDNPALGAICPVIQQSSQYAEDAVEGVCDWINDNITFAIDAGGGSDKVLESKRGNCISMAYLACAMLRKMGVPCDAITAKFLMSKNTHGFMEVYYPDTGWVFYDLSNLNRGFRSLNTLIATGTGYRIQSDPMRKFDWVNGYFSKEQDMVKYQKPKDVMKKALRETPKSINVTGVTVVHGPVPAGLPIRQLPLRDMMLDPNTVVPQIKQQEP